METAMMNSICRCCATEGVFKCVTIAYTWMGEEEIYADMLKECFDINLNLSESGEDAGICEVCITQLRNASNFKKQVLSTEEQLKKHAENKLFKPNIVKVEVTRNDDDSDDNMSAEEAYSGPEFEVPIKTETEESKPKKRTMATRASTSGAKKSKDDDAGETSTKREEGKTLEIEIEIESTQGKPSVAETKEMVMKNQNNIMQILLTTNATPILRQADVGYFCQFCESYYREPADLKQHNLNVHNNDASRSLLLNALEKRRWVKLDVTNLFCRLCNINIDSLDSLYDHLKRAHEMTIYTDMKHLIVPFSFINGVIRCCICLIVFEKFKKLMEHMHVHYRNFICDMCDLGFITYEVLAKHLQVHNTGTFACTYCPKIFDTLRKKRYHERFSHLQGHTFKYRCGYCVERFMESHQKDEHLTKVHGVPANLTCEACHKVFKCKKYLTKHIRREHLMERKFQCPNCEMRFFSVGELNRHSVKHSGIKEFHCEVCSKSFARKNTLTEHRRIHSNERRFKCDYCGHTFIQKCSWRSHMKTKHGVIVSTRNMVSPTFPNTAHDPLSENSSAPLAEDDSLVN